MKKRRRNAALDIVIGAAAGAAATWVMDAVTTAIQDRQSKESLGEEKAARGEKPAYEVAAEKGAEALGRAIDAKTRKKAGAAIHWTLGVSSGAAYGLLRNLAPSLGIGSGIAYGVLFWLVMDEAALTALGIAPPPQDFPWQTHARGLAGHLVLGAVIESAFDVLNATS